MSDFSPIIPWNGKAGGCWSTHSLMNGVIAVNPSSQAWPAANLAIFVPMPIAMPVTIYKLGIGAGTTAAGNFDVGIYDKFGNKIVSSGATAKGSSVEHILDITDTRLGSGLYYLALAADGTNNYAAVTIGANVQLNRLLGTLQAATAYTLPATVTFAARDAGYVPAIAAYMRPY